LKVKTEGKVWLKQQFRRYFNREEMLKRIKNPVVFKYEVIGLEIEDVIDEKTHYSIMLIEGEVWEKGNNDPDLKLSIQQIVDEGKYVFITYGINNLFLLYPKLKTFLDDPKKAENLGKEIKGIYHKEVKFNKDGSLK